MRRASFPTTDRSRSFRRELLLGSLALVAGIVLHATVLDRNSSDSKVQPKRDDPRHAAQSPSGLDSGDGGPGPFSTDHGMPAGFSRTPDGAVAAAASFVCNGQALLDMDPLSAEQAIRQISSSSTVDRQVADTLAKLQAARTQLAGGTGTTVYRQAAIAWRIDSFTPDRATVAIWDVGVLSRDGSAPPQASWAISRFELVWERGDWKVLDEAIAPGPAPILDNSAAPATAAQLASALTGFADFGGDR